MRHGKVLILFISVLITSMVTVPASCAIIFADEADTAAPGDAAASYENVATGDAAASVDTAATGGTSAKAEIQPGFDGYIHDPMKDPNAAKDIIVDPDAVYGYSPDPESVRLGGFASYDWTDPGAVAEMRKQREDYHESMKELYQMISDMTAEGRSTEEIARAVSTRRNEIRLEAYKDDPEGLEKAKASNLAKYGNENGPTPEYLYDRYGTWEIVINKALSPNQGADACLGLYDEYYDTYALSDDGRVWSEDWKYYVLNGRTYDKQDALAVGLTTIDGAKYFFEEGVMKTGLVTYEGSVYYFDKNGKMKTGVVRTGGKLYYFQKSGKGRAAKGWFKGTDKKKRYSLGNGRIASGVKKVGKTYYFFRTGNGTLQKKGFFKSGKKEYYSLGGGKLATGWKAIGKKACYFYPKGRKAGQMAKNTKVGYLKVPKSGRLGEAYALGIKTLDKNGWSLRSAYRFSYKLKYYDRWYRTSSSEKYSLRGFKQHRGNCYVMAATFYIQAKLLGYDVHQVRGHVGIWPHSWTIIRHGKKYYVYDPNFRNETGRNGWKIWYGKRGTWRYSGKHRMN
ncbi:MAG: hypothetical protein IJH41_06250 [Eubacterium sp.]|nr:hypothetical protein [Eubacterium sp.]